MAQLVASMSCVVAQLVASMSGVVLGGVVEVVGSNPAGGKNIYSIYRLS